MVNTFCGLSIRLVMKVVTQRKSDTRTGAQKSALRVMKNVQYLFDQTRVYRTSLLKFQRRKICQTILVWYPGQSLLLPEWEELVDTPN